jgi:adenine phosphoribosyltransferase
MSDDATIHRGRGAFREHFRWVDGIADTWAALREPEALADVVAALASLVEDDRPDVVVGIEARGFVLGPAVAVALGVGFVPVRKDGALFAGQLRTRTTAPDYRGQQHVLSTRPDLFRAGDRVVLVDDWIETGSQAAAAAAVIADCGAAVVSVAVVVAEASVEARAALPPIRALVRAADL